MLGQVSTQRFVDRSRVVERAGDIGLQEHDIGTLSVALVVLPRTPPRRSYSGLMSFSSRSSLRFFSIDMTF